MTQELSIGDWVLVDLNAISFIEDNGKILKIEAAKLNEHGTHYIYHMKGQKHDDWYSASWLKKVDIINIFDIEI